MPSKPKVSVRTQVISGAKKKELRKFAEDLRESVRREDKKLSSVMRGRVLKHFSDFASKRLLRETTKGDADFEVPKVLPDQAGSIESFRRVFGITLKKTDIQNAKFEAFNEIKQQTSEGIRTTLTSRSLKLDQGKDLLDPEVQDAIKLKKGNQELWHTWLNQPEQSVLKESILKQIEDKFENFTVINYSDKARKGTKGGTPQIRVLADAHRILNLRKNFRQYIDLSPEISRKKEKDITLGFKLNSRGYNKFIEKSTDVTDHFMRNAGGKIWHAFIGQVKSDFEKGKTTEEYLRAVYTFAREFELGDIRPVRYEITIRKRPNPVNIARITLIERVKEARKDPDSLIRIISEAQLSKALRISKKRKMPVGPLRGPPLSPHILTYRTGRFQKSIYTRIFHRSIKYYYNPIYTVHEATGRAPSRHLEDSLRNILKRRAGAVFSRKITIERGV